MLKWGKHTEGTDRDIVISSRIRLARNLNGYAFPDRLDEKNAEEVIDKIRGAFGPEYAYKDFRSLSAAEAQSYVERHEVSPEFAAEKGPHGLLINEQTDVSAMLCEEDHIRLQCILEGLSLQQAYERVCEADDKLDATLDIAFHERLGYLTHCPTNLGTGMRASVMLFLPALTMHRQIGGLSAQLQKLGLTMRGMFGEGSAADGALYQISNQVTLGITEEETIEKLSKIVAKIEAEEKKLRESLAKNEEICDQIARAEGTLRFARRISSSEFMSLYASLRLGISLGIVSGISYETLDQLLAETMPATLMLASGGDMTPEERDRARAERIRKALSAIE